MSVMKSERWVRCRRWAACTLVGLMLGAGCIVPSRNLPFRDWTGVLTTSDGTMYMVLSPCFPMKVDAVSLMYVPPGAPLDGPLGGAVVVSYRTVEPLAPRAVLAPLLGEPGSIVEGLELVERNVDLLQAALESKQSVIPENYFYVQVEGRLEDGSIKRVRSAWSSDLSRPDTVVAAGEVMDDPESRYCTRDGEEIRWDL